MQECEGMRDRGKNEGVKKWGPERGDKKEDVRRKGKEGGFSTPNPS